ncbi:XRE family transcriptional regulator [Trinickia symbiotica]|uniref:XRE family transcriptional regulator n=1 Tax=Trinickia symbiotica TaxID=863227 RepID=A0A2T3XLB3_9BURK|nr:helix-turn-helix transcriptional regulator [Trinickia symbiotica]PTB17315.1 XRE family transcriptional regulator [Trinickia symbiotica]
MEFSQRLFRLRKARGLSQQALADLIGVTVVQIYRYEKGASQPPFAVIRRLAIALGVSADALMFDRDERRPDDTLRYHFETISRMPEHEQQIVRELLDALIFKSHAINEQATNSYVRSRR